MDVMAVSQNVSISGATHIFSTQMMYSSGNTYFGLLGGYMSVNSAHIFKMAQKYLSNYSYA